MSLKLSSKIQAGTDLFVVVTTTRYMFIPWTPHSFVSPHLLNGKFTLQRGFAVMFTTSEPDVLEAWHDLLCRMLYAGKFNMMVEQARNGLFPFEEDDLDLMAYVKGFRCS
jgi:hypothetical protein